MIHFSQFSIVGHLSVLEEKFLLTGVKNEKRNCGLVNTHILRKNHEMMCIYGNLFWGFIFSNLVMTQKLLQKSQIPVSDL